MTLTQGQEQFLNDHRLAVITTLYQDGSPQSTPVYYVYDGSRLLVSSTRDRIKTKHLQRDSRVNLCVLDESFPFRYLQVRGRATISNADLVERSRRIYLTFRERLDDDFPQQLVQQGRIVIEITPEHASPDR